MGVHVVHKLQHSYPTWNGTDRLPLCISMGRLGSGGMLQAWAHITVGRGIWPFGQTLTGI